MVVLQKRQRCLLTDVWGAQEENIPNKSIAPDVNPNAWNVPIRDSWNIKINWGFKRNAPRYNRSMASHPTHLCATSFWILTSYACQPVLTVEDLGRLFKHYGKKKSTRSGEGVTFMFLLKTCRKRVMWLARGLISKLMHNIHTIEECILPMSMPGSGIDNRL